MALPDVRQRPGFLFGAVVLALLMLISAQVNTGSGVRLLEAGTLGVFAELQRAAAVVFSGVRGAWTGYVDLRGVRDENAALQARVATLRLELQEQRALAARAYQFQRLLGLRDRLGLPTAAADVIGLGASPDFRTVTIDKGALDGLEADMAVMAPEGLVGRVVTPGARATKVQLLIDRNAAAGVIVERTRAQGLVLGTGDALLRLEYLSDDRDLRSGDAIVTSGIDGVYPKGILVGRLDAIERDGGALRLAVRPAVDFRSLESVLVVLGTPAASDEGLE